MPRVAAAIGWAALALFIVYGSIRPLSDHGTPAQALPGISLPDIAQNVLLYVPFGMFGVWTLRRDGGYATVWVVALAAVYSSGVELLQQLSASRFTSALDVLANTLGAWAGAMASGPAERVLAATAARIRPTGLLTAPWRFALAAVLATTVVAAWYPFDVTLDVSTLSERTRPLRHDVLLQPGAVELWAQAGWFFVLAVMLTLCLPGFGKRAAPAAAVVATALAVIIDLGQVVMGSHPVGGAVLASQAAGAGAGSGAMFIRYHTGDRRPAKAGTS